MSYIESIKKFAISKLGYGKKVAKQLLTAFDCEKLFGSSNSGDYKYSSLATLGDSVAGLLLCEQYYSSMRKGEITNKKNSLLQNKVFDKVAEELDLPAMRYAEGRTVAEQELHSQFKDDPSAIFEAVVGAIYLDLGLTKLQAIWQEVFFPLIEKKYQVALGTQTNNSMPEAGQVLFEAEQENETEVIVFRPKKWSAKVKRNELQKGQVYFDKSEERGFDGQSIYFYKGTVMTAAEEYEERSEKTADCVLVYKIAVNDPPKALGEQTAFDTRWDKIKDSETCFCIKTDEANTNIFAEIKPFAIVCLSADKAAEIRAVAKELDIVAI
jgi:dsRNA-specific ribonuclease